MEIVGFLISEHFWGIVSGLVTLTMSITGLIGNNLKLEGNVKQVVAWGVSIVLTTIGYFAGLFTVSNPVWASLVLIGVVTGLVSNGVYDVPTIKSLINSITTFPKNKEKIKE